MTKTLPGPADPPDGSETPEPELLLLPREGVPDVVTSSAALDEAIARMAGGTGPVAVDAERASGYRYSQRAYLVQLRRRGAGTVLVDPIACPDLSGLSEVLTGVEWVLHAANQDLSCLAEVGMAPSSLFDTELGGRLAGCTRVGLGAMVENVLGIRLEKGHSAADWSTRPLPTDWLAYAALDVEVLVELRDAIETVLDEQGKLAWAREEFEAVRLAPAPAPRVDPWRRTSGVQRLRNRRQLAAVRALWEQRDDVARRRDTAPGRVLPDAAIINAVTQAPASPQELVSLPVFGGRSTRRHADLWFGALARAAALPESALPLTGTPTDGPPAPNRWAERDPVAAQRLVRARTAVGVLSAEHDVPAENLVQPDAVRRLAWTPPDPVTEATVAEALRGYGVRDWQVGLVAAPLAAALQAPASSSEEPQPPPDDETAEVVPAPRGALEPVQPVVGFSPPFSDDE